MLELNLVADNVYIKERCENMFCKNCGQELLCDSLFCSKCGEKVEQTVPPNIEEKPIMDNPKNENANVTSDNEIVIKKSHKGFWIVFSLLLVAAASIAYYFMFQPFTKCSIDSNQISELKNVAWNMSEKEVASIINCSYSERTYSDTKYFDTGFEKTFWVFGFPVDNVEFAFTANKLKGISFIIDAPYEKVIERYAERYNESPYIDEWNGQGTWIRFGDLSEYGSNSTLIDYSRPIDYSALYRSWGMFS